MNGIIVQSFLPALPGEPLPSANPVPFQLQETLAGTVLEQVDPRHVRIQIRGQDLLVENQIPLPVHQELLFRVEEIYPQVILRFLGEENQEAEPTLRSFLKKFLFLNSPVDLLAQNLGVLGKMEDRAIPSPWRETHKEFLALLQRFSFPAADSLPKIFASSGIFWENKIKRWALDGSQRSVRELTGEDLKGLGLKLTTELQRAREQGEASPEANALERGLEKFLHKLDLCQILTLQPFEQNERLFLLLPFWFADQWQFMELQISFPKGGAEPSRKEVEVLFLLHLPPWGWLRIEVKVREKDLFCLFKSSDPEGSKYISEAVTHLSDRLNHLGFHPHIHIATEPPEKLGPTILEEMEGKGEFLLNIRI